MLEKFRCPGCGAELTKKSSIVAKETVFDSIQNKTVSIPKQNPVLIRYTTQDGKHWEKKPDEDD